MRQTSENLCPNVIQTSLISLLNPEVEISVVKLDKAPGICSKPLGSTTLNFMLFVAFPIQTISLWLEKSIFPSSLCVLGGFLFLFSTSWPSSLPEWWSSKSVVLKTNL